MIDKTKLKAAIASAIRSYSDSERCALSYRDPNYRESAYEAMEKLDTEADKIAGYALLALNKKDTHNR
jgi:hypothetical protein